MAEFDFKKHPDFQFQIVENTQTNPQKLKLVYTVDPPRLKSVGTINHLYEMHELMSRSFEILAPLRDNTSPIDTTNYVSSADIDQSILEHGIFFAPDFPEFLSPNMKPTQYQAADQVPQHVITWGVVRSEPGTMSGPPFRGTQELRPRFREYIAYFGNQGRKELIGSDLTTIEAFSNKMAYVKVKAQAMDNLVQYNIWSKSNYEAERATEWFEDYMDNYTGMYREAGIVNMHMWNRVRDNTLVQMNNDYHVRSVLYYIRTERVRPEYIGPINQINLNISITDLKSYLESEDHNMSFTYDKLVNKWTKRNQLGG